MYVKLERILRECHHADVENDSAPCSVYCGHSSVYLMMNNSFPSLCYLFSNHDNGRE